MLKSFLWNENEYWVLTDTKNNIYVGIFDICVYLDLIVKGQVRKIRDRGFKLYHDHSGFYFLALDALEPWLATIRSHNLGPKRQKLLEAMKKSLRKEAQIAAAEDKNPEDKTVKELVNDLFTNPPKQPAQKKRSLNEIFRPSRSTLVAVPFEASPIYVAEDSRGQWVILQCVCERLGIKPNTAIRTLRRQKWASAPWSDVQSLLLPGESQRREYFVLHRKRFAMWLATLNQDLVDDDTLPVLEKYQCAAADVLDAHFMPKSAPSGNQEILSRLSNIERLVDKLLEQPRVGVEVSGPATVLPLVDKTKSFSMRALNEVTMSILGLTQNSSCSVHDDACREIASALGIIGDEKYGFWDQLANTTSGAFNYNWRFNKEGANVLQAYLQAYFMKRSQGAPKAKALEGLLQQVPRVGVGTDTFLSKQASEADQKPNGHKMVQNPPRT